MKSIEEIVETGSVKIFRLVTGEAVITAVDGDYMVCPFTIVQISNQGHLGFNPYCVFGQNFEKLERFKDVHVVATYDAEEEMVVKYRPAVLDALQKIRAARAGLVLDTNIPGAEARAQNVSAFKQIKKSH